MKLRLDPFSPHGVSVDNSTVTVAGGSTTTGGSSVTVTGEDYLTLAAQEITANPIDLDNLSATGTPSASTFLRGDNSWATPAGSADITVTVDGSGADYTNINDAIASLSGARSVHASPSITALVLIKTGYVISEQLFFENGIDLGWITLGSEDAEVTVTGTALTENFFTYETINHYPFMGVRDNATAPIIDTLFTMNTSGVSLSEVDGFFFVNNARGHFTPGSGFKNAAHCNIWVFRNSSVNAESGVFSGAGTIGARSLHCNIFNLQYGDVSGCGTHGLFANGVSIVGARGLVASNCGRNGIRARRGARIDAYQATMNSTGSAGFPAVSADLGAFVNLDGATITNSDVDALYAADGGTINASNITVTGSGGSNYVTDPGGVIILDDVTQNGSDVSVSDEAYGSGWNGSTEVPTKNAVYDQVETRYKSGDSPTFADLTLTGNLAAAELGYINTNSTRITGLLVPPSAGSVVNYIGQAKNILTYCNTLDTLSTTGVTNGGNAFDLAGVTIATLANSTACVFEITFATANRVNNINAFSITGLSGGGLANVTAIKLEEDFGSGYQTQFNDTDPNNSGYGNSAVSNQHYQRRFTLVGDAGGTPVQKIKITITTGSGTAVGIRMMSAYTPNLPDYSRFLAADADVVHDTGAETIAGVKTFTSDPIIPDEAYDATAWNGSLEPPTKNAVRDKIETMGGGGSGDVVGPASATDDGIPRYDGTTGKLLASSNITIPTSNGVDFGGGTIDSLSLINGVAAPTAQYTTTKDSKLSGIEALADVTDTANVTAAGALMDSEVDANIKTLSLPASTTITAAAATVLDDTTVGNMVDTLGGATSTGTGGLVRATSPALVTPALGTPSALVGTNITGTAAGLTAGTVTTNANLTGDVTSSGNATTIANGIITNAKLSTTTGEPGGAWNSWSPTLSGRLNDGKWTKAGAYLQVGKTVHAYLQLTANAATPADGGTAEFIIALPVTAPTLGSQYVPVLGTAQIVDGGVVFAATVVWNTTTTCVVRHWLSSGTIVQPSTMSSTNPFTWASGDQIYINITYQAA